MSFPNLQMSQMVCFPQSYPKQLAIEQLTEKIHKFEKLKQEYSVILTSGPFKEGGTDVSPELCQIVDNVDYCLVSKVNAQEFICVTGVGTSFALCARGKNKEGETFVAVTHETEFTIDPSRVLEKLMEKLVEKRCENIEIYIIGGVLEEDTECIDIEEEFLDISNKYPIKGARFNIAAPATEIDENNPNAKLETLTILFSASEIIFSKKN